MLLAFSLGLLLGNAIESWFLRTVLLVGSLALGVLLWGRRR